MLVHTRARFTAGAWEENRYLVAPDRVAGVNSREQTTLYEPGSCKCLSLLCTGDSLRLLPVGYRADDNRRVYERDTLSRMAQGLHVDSVDDESACNARWYRVVVEHETSAAELDERPADKGIRVGLYP